MSGGSSSEGSTSRKWSLWQRKRRDEEMEEIDEGLQMRRTHISNNLSSMREYVPELVAASTILPRTRTVIERNREISHDELVRDYFAPNCTYPPQVFRRRFRMRRELFLRIKDDLEGADTYFQRLPDCVGRLGLSALQKMTAAFRLLAYGGPVDRLDEYIKIGESTAKETLLKFCENIIKLYKHQYLRTPDLNDITRLMEENAERGFPGMVGSLDCMHWEWRGCPSAWHGQFVGHVGRPTLILEAVASYDLWIWHAFFRMPGTHNDLTVLRHSNLFYEFLRRHTPQVQYTVNGHVYHTPYYLTDDIYPQYATLMQTIPHPRTPQQRVFARAQESIRKDVERAFGVLQSKWGITQGPVRYYKMQDLKKIMITCIILHNMIIEDERHMDIDPWVPPSDEFISTIDQITDPEVLANLIHMRMEQIRDNQVNASLRRDLMAHIWNMYGNLDI